MLRADTRSIKIQRVDSRICANLRESASCEAESRRDLTKRESARITPLEQFRMRARVWSRLVPSRCIEGMKSQPDTYARYYTACRNRGRFSGHNWTFPSELLVECSSFVLQGATFTTRRFDPP